MILLSAFVGCCVSHKLWQYKLYKLGVFRLRDYEILVPGAECPGPKKKELFVLLIELLLLSLLLLLLLFPRNAVTVSPHPTSSVKLTAAVPYKFSGSDRRSEKAIGQCECSYLEGLPSLYLQTGHDHYVQLATQLHIFTFVSCRQNVGKRCILCPNNAGSTFTQLDRLIIARGIATNP